MTAITTTEEVVRRRKRGDQGMFLLMVLIHIIPVKTCMCSALFCVGVHVDYSMQSRQLDSYKKDKNHSLI